MASSPAQIDANRTNAQHSTGPVTPEGRTRASQNATRSGLFAKRDCIPPHCREEYEILRERLTEEIKPATMAESVVAREIVSAAWRLERCAQAEACLDPEVSFLDSVPALAAIERARAAAERSLSRGMAELRKLQTERCSQAETIDLANLGLASLVPVCRAFGARGDVLRRQRKREAAELNRSLEMKTPPAAESEFAKRSQSEPGLVARNAPCPCGSGQKFKRCCGASAPPLLSYRTAA